MQKYFLFVLLFSFVLFSLIFRLTYYNFYVFDEVYYAQAARDLYHGLPDPNFQHPFFGKWLISVPMYFMGDSRVISWRIMPILFSFLGLVLLYFFARRLKLPFVAAALVVLGLLFSGSWYIISRVAMLDMFLAVFILVSAFFLYLFLSANSFSKNIAQYSFKYYYIISAGFLGAATACKWNGAFPILFLLGLFLFVFTGSPRVRIFFFSIYCLVVLLVYSVLNLAVIKFNYPIFLMRNFGIISFHTTEVLPDNLVKHNAYSKDQVKALGSGPFGLFNFLFHNHVYYLQDEGQLKGLKRMGMSNNQFIAASFIAATVLLVMSFIGYVVRKYQNVKMITPVFLSDPVLLYLYFYSFCLMVPWLLFARLQYLFYFMPAFPFILLLTTYYLFRYSSSRMQLFYYTGYFAFSVYWMFLWIPL